MLQILPIYDPSALNESKARRLAILEKHDEDHPEILISHTRYIPDSDLLSQPSQSSNPPPQFLSQPNSADLPQPTLCSCCVKASTIDTSVQTGVILC